MPPPQLTGEFDAAALSGERDTAPASIRSADTREERLRDVIKLVSEQWAERGSASEAEEHTAQFVAAELKAIGLVPQQQNFLGLTSTYSPYILATGLTLLSLFLFWHTRDAQAMALAALVLLGVVIAALVYELSARDNPLRWWLSPEYSQNIFVHVPAVLPAATPTPPTLSTPPAPILITTHLDTHRTPLLLSSPGRLQFFRRIVPFMVPVGLISLGALWVLYLIGFVTGLEAARWIALVPGAVVLLIFGLLVQAARSPFSPGANDNASGIAAGLELAAQLAQSPLQHHDVYLVFTGGGEAGGSGADAFIREHLQNSASSPNPPRPNAPIHLVINRIAGQGRHPTLVRREQLLRPATSDAGLLQVAAQVAAQVQAAQSALPIQVRDLSTTYSELSVGARHGLRTLGFTALPASTAVEDVVGDTLAHCDMTVAASTTAFIWDVLQAVDGAQGAPEVV